jgi:hypothetical protein
MDFSKFLTADPTTLPPPENNFDALPAGKYLVAIDKAEVKESKNKPGNHYVSIQYSVVGADFTNRKIFEIINFKNDNEVAERIGTATLGELMRSIGVKEANTDAFIGKNLYVKVKIGKDVQGNPSNSVTYHEAFDSGMSTPSAPKAQGLGMPKFGK